MTFEEDTDTSGFVAIVGMGARFPGAPDVESLWQNLRNGVESVTWFTPEELRKNGVPQHVLDDPTYVPAAAVLDDIAGFDADLFDIPRPEAELLDPQHRIFLETAWSALEDAGYNPKDSGLTAGVFAGCSSSTYLLYNLHARLDQSGADFNLSTLVANDKDYLPSRVAYKLGLSGPALGVQTACSTSLVSVHLACQSLLTFECDLALAGGVTIRVPHRMGYMNQGGSMLSPDGHCRAFDAEAGGTLPGSGAGVVVLKRLDDALEQGDDIRAIIRGSAVNNDGSSKAWFTAPNVDGQVDVIKTAHAVADIDPSDLGYIEAHGTGTGLGDPIEITALGRAMDGAPIGNCAIGSIKTNFGHLECAAGIAGLIKAVLTVQNGEIPPSLGFSKPNPKIDFEHSPVRVNSQLTPWKTAGAPRRAGVSSFGFGGTNCHVVLEQAPMPAPRPEQSTDQHVLLLSARSPDALETLRASYHSTLQTTAQTVDLRDICYTAATGRATFNHRIACAARTTAELVENLKSHGTTGNDAERNGDTPKLAFLFGDHAAELPTLGRQLYEIHPAFRDALDRCDSILRPLIGQSIMHAMWSESAQADLALPATTALHIALVELWASLGVHPDMVLGTGTGKFAAAWAAGALSMESALDFAAKQAAGVILEQTEVVSNALSALRIPLLSVDDCTLTEVGSVPAASDILSRDTQTEGFENCLKLLMQNDFTLGIDMSSSAEPRSAVRPNGKGQGMTWLPCLLNAADDQFDVSAGKLWEQGINVDWREAYANRAARRVPLPTYPFEHQTYWIEPSTSQAASLSVQSPLLHPLLGRALDLAGEAKVYENALNTPALAYLRDHRIRGAALFPGSGFLEVFVAAASDVFESKPHVLTEIEFQQALVLPEDDRSAVLQTRVEKSGVHAFRIEIFSRIDNRDDGSEWVRHAVARVQLETAAKVHPVQDIAELKRACPVTHEIPSFYEKIKERGLEYEQVFKCLQTLNKGERQGLASIDLPTEFGVETKGYSVHPALLDACFQIVGLEMLSYPDGTAFLPMGAEEMRVFHPLEGPLWGHIQLRSAEKSGNQKSENLNVDVRLYNNEGLLIAEILGMSSIRLDAGRNASGASSIARYAVDWIPCPLEQSETLTTQDAAAWLLLDDGGDDAQALADALSHQNISCLHARVVDDPTECAIDSTGPACIARDDLNGFKTLLSKAAQNAPLAGVLYLSKQRGERAATGPLELAKALLESDAIANPSLIFATHHSQAVFDDLEHPSGGIIWGFARSLAAEHPELNVRLVDLDFGTSAQSTAQLINEMTGGDAETQIAYRNGTRYGARLSRVAHEVAKTEAYQVLAPSSGLLADLKPETFEIPTPGPTDVLVETHASSLDFRDVLMALGMYPGAVAPLGGECAGKIVAVGDEVANFNIGDNVVCVSHGALSSHVIAPAALTVPKPAALTAQEASAVPIVFLTVHYAFKHCAKLTAGQRVLIHSAAGGVGQAAVQLALKQGAEVFATAGSSRKRQFLRDQGVQHVFDSRSDQFREDVLNATNGEGVDVVLNSLGGDLIPASFDTLREGGVFLEIGKGGIWSDAEVKETYPTIQYHVIAMDHLQEHERDLIRAMMIEVLDHFACGHWELPRIENFDIEDLSPAFRRMQKAQHIGKIVIRHSAGKTSALREDGSYLITGGSGEIGHLLAAHLVEQGARHIVLTSRRALDAKTQDLITSLENAGAQVRFEPADIANKKEVHALLDRIRNQGPRLRGVFHLAGALDDGAINALSAERFAQVLAPKVSGAWNLHNATSGERLDHFVMFSSVASILGVAFQAPYAAANSYLDALAHHRRSLGLPTLSVNWGRWSVGMAARMAEAEQKRMTEWGVNAFSTNAALQELSALMSGARPQEALALINWQRLVDSPIVAGTAPYFSALVSGAQTKEAANAQSSALRLELEALPLAQRSLAMLDAVRDLAARALGTDGAQIDLNSPLMDMGLDSLVAVELRNTIAETLGVRLPSTLLFDYPSITKLAEYLEHDALGWHAVPEPSTPSNARNGSNGGGVSAPPKDAHITLNEPSQDIDFDDLTEAQLAAVLQDEIMSWDEEKHND
ncbi:type I polyketide synthase [Planktotalea sp.]|uniref:type I polyketide synthase n=1 Tax=Planktotalea sp. TaxID=2029877 RepID=UPI0032967DFC